MEFAHLNWVREWNLEARGCVCQVLVETSAKRGKFRRRICQGQQARGCIRFTYCVWHLNGINESLNVIIGLHADDVINDLIHLKQEKTGMFEHTGRLPLTCNPQLTYFGCSRTFSHVIKAPERWRQSEPPDEPASAALRKMKGLLYQRGDELSNGEPGQSLHGSKGTTHFSFLLLLQGRNGSFKIQWKTLSNWI